MQRLSDHYLAIWRRDPSRTPLLIRGARQVGKTFTVRKLGESFGNLVEVKHGTRGWLRSLRLFLESRSAICPYGVHFSPHNFSVMSDLQSYPLYAVGSFAAQIDPEVRRAIQSLA